MQLCDEECNQNKVSEYRAPISYAKTNFMQCNKTQESLRYLTIYFLFYRGTRMEYIQCMDKFLKLNHSILFLIEKIKNLQRNT